MTLTKKVYLYLKAAIGLAPILFYIGHVNAAPKSELWAFWNQYSAGSEVSVDHSRWQAILDRYLRISGQPPVTLFDYGKVSADDKKRLQAYINSLLETDVFALDLPEQKAFWINLYNAATVNLILDHYPLNSIRDIRFGFFSFGPWDQKLMKINDKELSLNDIEHRILRPIWQDARIHYGVNCASVGCPNLTAEAYTASNTESLLDQAARDYINHPRGVGFEGTDLVLSSIYKWYRADFGASENEVIEHLKKYVQPELKERLNSHVGGVDYFYDWQLNSP